MRFLAAAAWIATFGLWAVGHLVGSPDVGIALVLAALGNLMPTVLALHRRHDDGARMVMGTLPALIPGLYVFVLQGHPWQIDAHMYFFVALTGLAVLCDWKPVAIGAVLIAAHHSLLHFFAPHWVFNGNENLGRIVIHAVAVVAQLLLLSFIIHHLRAFMKRQHDAQIASAAQAERAEEEKVVIEAALAAARNAEQREAAERQKREQAEQLAAENRRTEMHLLADSFQASVAHAVTTVGSAASDLEQSAHSLNELAKSTSMRTSETAAAASQSSVLAQELAHYVGNFRKSITAIATTVDEQAKLSEAAQGVSLSGHERVKQLGERTITIGEFIDSIRSIASRTNMLALNASIEAARCGEAGHAFAVVASEVKQLAGRSTDATQEILALAHSMTSGADAVRGALDDINQMVANLAQAANAIKIEVAHQRDAAAQIERTAQNTADSASTIASDVGIVAHAAGDTENLSGRVSSAASDLSQTAQGLLAATDHFVRQLKTG